MQNTTTRIKALISLKKIAAISITVGALSLWSAEASACGCGSGLKLPPKACGAGYSQKVQKMHDENQGSMISCCRPQAYQDKLRQCYIRCGQPGRAAKRSKHSSGRACDVTNLALKNKYSLSLLYHHGSKHLFDGGGGGDGGAGAGGSGSGSGTKSKQRYQPVSKALQGGKNRNRSRFNNRPSRGDEDVNTIMRRALGQ